MKTQITRFMLATAFVAMAFSAAFANGRSNKSGNNANEDIAVNLVKEEDNFLILQIKLDKQDSKFASLRISDGGGEVLYTERITNNQLVRYIKVSPSEVDNLVVTLNTSNGTKSRKYKLLTEKQTIVKLEEVAVL
jgi:hypothetical protein